MGLNVTWRGVRAGRIRVTFREEALYVPCMSTYVINNRIPRFPIRAAYADRLTLQKRLEDAFQVWLKERFISNLERRKVCSQVYDFSVWMGDARRVIEDSRPADFAAWCETAGAPPRSDWGGFLRYARLRVPELGWTEADAKGPASSS
jgi:hypothetical protein